MAVETILQNEILRKFVYPFLLIFFLLFAIFEKLEVFGKDKKQLSAMIAFVIALIFVAFTYPKIFVENMILFLTVAIVIVFIVLLLWGFIMGDKDSINLFKNSEKWFKITVAVVILIVVVIAVLWASGLGSSVIDLLFNQSWSSGFWTNAIFLIVVAVALAVVLMSSKD